MTYDIDDEIYRELNNLAALTAIVGIRIEKYFGELDIERPYITFSPLPGEEIETKISRCTQRYQFLIVGNSNSEVKNIKSIILNKLNGFGGLLGDFPAGTGVTVIKSFFINNTPNHDNERKIYRLSNEYQFLYYSK